MRLTVEQLTTMSRLLDEALPLDAGERRAWLEALSEQHQDLAPALRRALLREEPEFSGLEPLATLAKYFSAEAADEEAARGLEPGAHVGSYELIRRLGAGGMAEVWLARRADGALKREVALKLPMRIKHRADLEQRFARERDILASLEYVHIARLYDAGVDPNGLPYLAMEYVQGQALTDWCDTRRISIPERLLLFLQVLEAVQYAHEKHVIHRDLKPSNILVTESGQVRLLDFGVAKLLEADEAENTQLTSVYGRALTPDYASPELLLGHAIDARSDIYSLGVLLYELLTGTRPYMLGRAASLGVLEAAILSVEVKKPSAQYTPEAIAARGASPSKLTRQLRGDLDAIVLKSLEKNPSDRYSSVAALAQDLRRYIEGKPIEARPGRLDDRFGKFVRRNRTMVGVCAVAAAAILAALAYTLHHEKIAQATMTAGTVPAGADTATIGDRSIAVLPFLDLSEKHDQEYFADGMAEEIINLLTKIPDLKVIGRTSSFQFKGKTDDLRSIGKTLGAAYVVEGSVRRSGDHIRLAAQLIDTRDGVHRWSETYDREASDALKIQDEIAVSLVRALQLEVSASSHLQSRAPSGNGEAYDSYLRGLHAFNRFDQAGFDEAVADFRRALELDPLFVPAAEQLARTLCDQPAWGFVPPQAGFEQARAAAAAALKLDPKSALAHAILSCVHVQYDWDWTAAKLEMRTAVALTPNDPTVLVFAAAERLAIGDWTDAVHRCQAAIAVDPLHTTVYEVSGWAYLRLGRFTEAESAFRRSLEISATYATGHHDLGIALLMEGKTEAALAEMQYETLVGWQNAGLAVVYQALHRTKDADAALARLQAENTDDMAFEIAEAFAFRGQKDLAFKWLDRAYAQKDIFLWPMKGDPLLKNLEGDPRYEAFLRKMNLPV